MLTHIQRFLEGTVGHLLSYYEDAALLNGEVEYFDDEIRSNVLQTFEVFWKLDVRKFMQFEGHR